MVQANGSRMPIWKFVYALWAMSEYLGTPLVFVIPQGVMVVEMGGEI